MRSVTLRRQFRKLVDVENDNTFKLLCEKKLDNKINESLLKQIYQCHFFKGIICTFLYVVQPKGKMQSKKQES